METGRVISGCRFEWSPRFGILFGPTTRLILCSQNMRMPLELILNAGQGLYKLKLPNKSNRKFVGAFEKSRQSTSVQCSLCIEHRMFCVLAGVCRAFENAH